MLLQYGVPSYLIKKTKYRIARGPKPEKTENPNKRSNSFD